MCNNLFNVTTLLETKQNVRNCKRNRSIDAWRVEKVAGQRKISVNEYKKIRT